MRYDTEKVADIEKAVRVNFTKVVATPDAPDDLGLDLDMVDEYGLTSLNKVLFLTAVCEDTGVAMANFTEHDLARMRTLRDVTEALARNSEKAV